MAIAVALYALTFDAVMSFWNACFPLVIERMEIGMLRKVKVDYM